MKLAVLTVLMQKNIENHVPILEIYVSTPCCQGTHYYVPLGGSHDKQPHWPQTLLTAKGAVTRL